MPLRCWDAIIDYPIFYLRKIFTLTSSEPLTALDKKEGSPKPEGMLLRKYYQS
jgi:hypothetical protein